MMAEATGGFAMGMYTEVFFRARLRPDTPGSVIGILCRMIGRDAEVEVPTGPLFAGTTWSTMFRHVSNQFPRTTMSTLCREDGDGGPWVFAALSSFKNHGDEFEHFCDWIAPHVDARPGEFLGYSLYETADEPTLVYLGADRKVIWVDASGPPDSDEHQRPNVR